MTDPEIPKEEGEMRQEGTPDDPSPRPRKAEFVRHLPLEARIDRTATGWAVELPVRADRVRVDKQAFVVEELLLRRHDVERVKRVEETVREERLRVDTEGEVKVRGPHEPA